MSATGSCHETAVVEAFLASLKRERTKRKKYRTRTEARANVFGYIERSVNGERRHEYVGNISTAEFEERTFRPDETVHET